MFCQNCGYNVKDNDIYCPACGSKIERGEPKEEIKKEIDNKPINEKKWVQPLMITLFIVTLLSWFFGLIIYAVIVVVTMDDPLDFSNYIKPYLAIIELALSILCLSLGIFFKVKKYQTVKNIVVGILGTLGALIGVVTLGLVQGEINKATTLSPTSEYFLDLKVIEPLLPTKYESKAIIESVTDFDGNTEETPIYIYLRFTSKVEITIFETEIENSDRWHAAPVSKNSVLRYDYYLIYNYNDKTFDKSDLANSLVFYYSKEHNSMAIIPGALISYMASIEGFNQ